MRKLHQNSVKYDCGWNDDVPWKCRRAADSAVELPAGYSRKIQQTPAAKAPAAKTTPATGTGATKSPAAKTSAAGAPAIKTQKDQASYAIGLNIGQGLA